MNVLNAAFMTAATAVVSALQYGGATTPLLLAGLGLSNLLVVGLVLRAWGRQGVQDIASSFSASLTASRSTGSAYSAGR